jgi:hypothetical protein
LQASLAWNKVKLDLSVFVIVFSFEVSISKVVLGWVFAHVSVRGRVGTIVDVSICLKRRVVCLSLVVKNTVYAITDGLALFCNSLDVAVELARRSAGTHSVFAFSSY